MIIEPAQRAKAAALNVGPYDSAAARRGLNPTFTAAILGLTPQALCCCPLRGLSESESLNASVMRQACYRPFEAEGESVVGKE
jgi:hypothetical protein